MINAFHHFDTLSDYSFLSFFFIVAFERIYRNASKLRNNRKKKKTDFI